MSKLIRNKDFQYKSFEVAMSGYTTTYNCVKEGFPFEISIKSFLQFVNEVVVVDGYSSDGTYEVLQKMAQEDLRIKLYQNEFLQDPGCDGQNKAFARCLCENDILVQFDVDEIAHEDDVEKWKLLAKKFPKDTDILHCPVVELWGDLEHSTYRRHMWKWRLSRNKPEITHAINKYARLTDEKTGKVYARKGMSDGCEYVNVMTYEPLPHKGFWNEQLDVLRAYQSEQFGVTMNKIVGQLPSVYHTSWLDLPRKVHQLQPGGIWDQLWSLIYQEKTQDRFPGVEFSDEKQVNALVEKLKTEGGEESDKVKGTFKLTRPPPKILQDWWSKNK